MVNQTEADFRVTAGINLDKAEQIATRLGCEVIRVRRTGEVQFRHHLMPRPCRVNRRRHCAPRHLVIWLRRVVATVVGLSQSSC